MHTLVFLEPGHFHAALTLRRTHPRIDPVVHVYAQEGPELDAFLGYVEAFNSRSEAPTAWEPRVSAGPEPLERLLAEGKGDVAVLAGRNDSKMAHVQALHAAGYAVLADKPMLTGVEWLSALEAVTAGPPLVMDIMTGRYEVASQLLKRLVDTAGVFGGFAADATEREPAIEIATVHHLYKLVNGEPLRRPVWYFDERVQGDGLVDVPTHLVDRALWLLDGPPFRYEDDVELLGARLWPTPVPLEHFRRITGAEAFPAAVQPNVQGGGEGATLHYPCNGEIRARLRSLPVRLTSEWHLEDPASGGESSHLIRLRGRRAVLRLEHGPATGYDRRIYVEPQVGEAGVRPALEELARRLQPELPGLQVVPTRAGFALEVPEALHTGHETHFAMVLDAFLNYTERGSWPPELPANLRTRYTLLARASALAQQQPKQRRA